MLELTKLTALFGVTALAAIVGCYLPWLVLTRRIGVAVVTAPRILGPVFLAAHAASDNCGPHLCGIWWRIHRSCFTVATVG